MTNIGSSNVTVINTADNTVLATLATQQNPTDAAVSPDGRRLYVTNYTAGSVTVIDTGVGS